MINNDIIEVVIRNIYRAKIFPTNIYAGLTENVVSCDVIFWKAEPTRDLFISIAFHHIQMLHRSSRSSSFWSATKHTHGEANSLTSKNAARSGGREQLQTTRRFSSFLWMTTLFLEKLNGAPYIEKITKTQYNATKFFLVGYIGIPGLLGITVVFWD